MASVPEIAQVLRELKESIEKQGTLLGTLISRLEAGRDAQEADQETDQHTPPAAPESDDEHSDERETDIASASEGNSEATGSGASRLRSFAKFWVPWAEERVAFYRVNGLIPSRKISVIAIRKSLADTIRDIAPQPRNAVATSRWRYCKCHLRCLFVLYSLHDVGKANPAREAHFLLLGIPVYDLNPMNSRLNIGGRPDYVPPWEIRNIEGRLFHIDDIKLEQPLVFDEDAIDYDAMIPYSFTPPTPAGDHGEALIAATGMTVEWSYLRNCLGNLYSVPPDGRIPLAFERNELRLKCGAGDIDAYLLRVKARLQHLQRMGGSFSIFDGDTLGHWTVYSASAEDTDSFNSELVCWKAAAPSLFSESRGLIVHPSSNGHLIPLDEFKEVTPRSDFEGPNLHYDLSPDNNVIRRPRAEGMAKSRNWYRVIQCQGIASIMGFTNSQGPVSSEAAEKKWRTLIYSSNERPRLDASRHRIIQEAFNLHISCSRIRRAGNHHLAWWKPFHIAWFQILDGDVGEEQLRASSWKYGPLYGSTKKLLVQEACFTLAFVPHIKENVMSDDMQRASWQTVPPSIIKKDGIDFWTILLLSPSPVEVAHPAPENPAMHVLKLIKEGLEMAANAWEGLLAHFNVILDDQHTLLDPRGHDDLLFDDDTFSRSRLYFWAMDGLEVFITQIKDTISEWEDFWAARETMIRVFEEVHHQRMCDLGRVEAVPTGTKFELSNLYLDNIRGQINRLRDYQVHFEAFRAKTDALRGGVRGLPFFQCLHQRRGFYC